MKNNPGLYAMLAAAMMVAVRGGGPGAPPSQSNAAQTAGTPRGAGKKTAPRTEPAKEPEPEGPWLATRYFFAARREAPKLKSSKVDPGIPNTVDSCTTPVCISTIRRYFGIEGDLPAIDFVIATVPDPLHTHLALMTDTHLQAVETAADRAGWSFADQWLPWSDSIDPGEKDPEQRRAQRADIREQERQPGILAFRKSESRVLLIFVVGETPTAGINPTQFQLARAYMRALGESETVRIVGPTFSGSYPSLASLLERDVRIKEPGGNTKCYVIRSGSATSLRAGEDLRGRLPGRIDFHGATADSSDQKVQLRNALNSLHIDPSKAAILVEDESAYGDVTAAADGIRVFRFPRDVSHVRNAYRDAVQESKDKQDRAPGPDFSIRDPEAGEDSIPMFSTSQSPLSQNGVINEIADAIRRERYRLVQIDATNVLDTLFLAGVLKRQCPDTRLLIRTPDVLFTEAASDERLQGMLFLTNYPMFFEHNAWMGQEQSRHPIIFSDANSESVYNATALLLDPYRVVDYSWRGSDHPPTWLLTLDRQGVMPIDLYPASKEQKEKLGKTWFMPVTPTNSGVEPEVDPPAQWTLLSIVFGVICVVVAIWVGLVSMPESTFDGRLSITPETEDRMDEWRRFYVVILLLALLTAAFAIVAPELATSDRLGRTAFPLVAGLLDLLAAIWAVFLMNTRKPAFWFSVLGLLGAGVFCFRWYLFCGYEGDSSLFFSLRTLEMRFGSSPLWPVLACLVGIGLFAFFQATRLYLPQYAKPPICVDDIPTLMQPRLKKAHSQFNATIERAGGLLPGPELRHLIGSACCAAGVIVVAWRCHVPREMQSIDFTGYNRLILILQALLMALLLLGASQIRAAWHQFSSLLTALATLPLLDSFCPLEHSGAESPIWIRRLQIQSVYVYTQSAYLLHDMVVLNPREQALSDADGLFRILIGILMDEGCAKGRRKNRETVTALRLVRLGVAYNLFPRVREEWLKRELSATLLPTAPARGGEEGKDNGDRQNKSGRKSRGDRFHDVAERFLALHYSAFIMYGVSQIRNLIYFLSGGFLLLVASLSSYSFQSPQFIGRILLVLALILGTITVRCLMAIERNAIISRIAGSDPGKLNSEFYIKLAGYGALPVLGLLASEFPSISNFLFSWVEPTLEAFK